MALTYIELLNETIRIYLTEDYEKAYSYISDHADKVTGNLAQIYNFRYAIASKMGKKELSLNLMEEAIVDHKFWYASEYLESDEDLDNIRNEAKFHMLSKICTKREKEFQKECKGQVKRLETTASSNTLKKQLFIVLHGNQENNIISKYYWKSVLNDKRIIAFFQSSEIEFSDAYNWNDLELGTKVVETLKEKLENEVTINVTEDILAGFSAGGRQVLYYTLFNQVKVKGLILIAPWLPELDAWENKISFLKNNRIKVYIICGDKDEDSYEDSKILNQLLTKYKVEHKFIEIENLEHDYPNEFSDVIEKGIDYINN